MEDKIKNLRREIRRFLILLVSLILIIPVLLYLKSQDLLFIDPFTIEAVYIVLLFITAYRLICVYKTTAVELMLKQLESNVRLKLSQLGEYLVPLYVMDKVSKVLNNGSVCYLLVTQHILNGIYSAILVNEVTFNRVITGHMYYFNENIITDYPGLNVRQRRVLGGTIYSVGSEISKPDFLKLFDFLETLEDNKH